MCAAVVGGGVLLQFQECTKVLEVAVVGVLMLRVDDIAVPQRARTPSCLIARSHVIHAGVPLQRQADQGGRNRPFAGNGQNANRPMGVSHFRGRGVPAAEMRHADRHAVTTAYLCDEERPGMQGNRGVVAHVRSGDQVCTAAQSGSGPQHLRG